MREPSGDRSELRVLDEDGDWPAADYFMSCRRCKARLGIRKIEEQMKMFT